MRQTTGITRRRFVAGAPTALLAGAAVPGAARAGGTAPPGPWRIGAGRREITPPLGVGILMSSGRREWAPFEGVRLSLEARAIVIDNGQTRVGLVSLDLLGLAGEAVGGMDDFKRRISAHAGHVLQSEHLVLASTHTHSGPESLALSDLYRTRPFQSWVKLLAERIGEALRDAARSLRACRLMVGSIPAPGLSVNRRIKTARGIVTNRAVRPNDVVYGPEGPTDDEVRVIAFEAIPRTSEASKTSEVSGGSSGQPAAIVVNAAAHPVYEMCIKQVSPDYPGEMTRLLDRRHPGATALFLQGAAGNINPPHVSTGPADAARHGRQLADLVDRALGKLRPVQGNQLAMRWRSIKLPARTPEGEPQAEPLVATLGALRLGSAAMLFLPGEPFVEIALAIRKASPFDFTAVVGYAESYVGYIPTDRAFANGGYEPHPGRWSRVARGSEAIVRREAIALLKSFPQVGSPPAS